MIGFINDYSESAAPDIFKALTTINSGQFTPYGEDSISDEARQLIAYEIQNDSADIHFLEGGTQANLTVISAALRSHEAALATNWGHIATHETGAIEATGHKVVVVPHHDGKLTIDEIKKALSFHADEHLVKIKLLYISQTTEWGSVYSKQELADLADFAHSNDMFLFIDGARMGSALTVADADFSLADVANYADAFTIGGTKNGALIGESVVITNPVLKEDFRYVIKQKGGLMAKGWILGIQFRELFRDGLFYRLAEHSNIEASKIRATLVDMGVELMSTSQSNQLFPLLPLDFIMELSENFGFQIIEKIGDDKAVIRLVTSWATTDTDVLILQAALEKYKNR